MGARGLASTLSALAVVLALSSPARAELRISDLEVFLNDVDITVNVVLLGAVPATFHESIHSGIPAHARFTIELYQYNRLWVDSLVVSRVVERQLAYNVVSREYKVVTLQGEERPPYVTRELRDAQRVLSEVRWHKLAPASRLDPLDVFYVRVRAETALKGVNDFFARLTGAAAETERQSEYRTLLRVQ